MLSSVQSPRFDLAVVSEQEDWILLRGVAKPLDAEALLDAVQRAVVGRAK